MDARLVAVISSIYGKLVQIGLIDKNNDFFFLELFKIYIHFIINVFKKYQQLVKQAAGLYFM